MHVSQIIKAHKASHESGGSDEIVATGLVGAGGGSGIYGDGSDGNVTIAVPTTLTRDMFYENLTVNDVLTTDGYRIFVKDTLTNTSVIERDGDDGDSANGGAGAATPGLTAGSLGASGGGGRATGAQGGGGAAGGGVLFIAAKTIVNSGGIIRANGGDGGDGISGGGAGGAGGAAGVATAPPVTDGGFLTLPLAHLLKKADATSIINGGGGGGGGGASGGAGDPGDGMNPSLGGSGGAGGARVTQGGGGGGGGGGVVILIYNSLTAGTEEANGGAGGAGNAAGAAGSNGVVIKITNA